MTAGKTTSSFRRVERTDNASGLAEIGVGDPVGDFRLLAGVSSSTGFQPVGLRGMGILPMFRREMEARATCCVGIYPKSRATPARSLILDFKRVKSDLGNFQVRF